MGRKRKREPRPYVDRGRPGELRYRDGELLRVDDPPVPKAKRLILTLQSLRRHNTLEPELQPTDRMLLRWSEWGGSGLPDPEAEIRKTHFDPLPLEQAQIVSEIVDGSPWAALLRKWYLSTHDTKKLADKFGISRAQLYIDWKCALWYVRGRLEDVRRGLTV